MRKSASESGAFEAEIAPVTFKTRKGEVTVSMDEGPAKVRLDKIPTLKPAFKKDGAITAAVQLQHQRWRCRSGA